MINQLLLRNALTLDYSDSDVARAYYVAYNTLINERISGGYTNMKENKKYAEKSIMSMIKKMNPLDVSNESKGRVISKRNEFLNFLSPKNRALAKKLEKEYHYKVRDFKRIIYKSKYIIIIYIY